ncbi:MBL fold metallo-hydrolase [Spirochaetota bacterium]
MKEVFPGIYMISEKSIHISINRYVNVFVITGKDGIIFDAGYGDKKSIKYLQDKIKEIKELCSRNEKPCNISRILVSHSHVDHFSGLYMLRKLLGLKVIVTEKIRKNISARKYFIKSIDYKPPDQAWNLTNLFEVLRRKIFGAFFYIVYKTFIGLRFIKEPDVIIDEKSKISINDEEWDIFPTPGHAEDHLSLYDPKRGILLSGDNVLNNMNTWLGPPGSDLFKYKESLEFILSLPNLKLILASHGMPVENPKERIREIIDWRTKRTEDLFDFINKSSRNSMTLKEIINGLYKNDKFIRRLMVRGWIQLSLDYLIQTGRIGSKIKKGRIYYLVLNDK